MHSQFLCKSWKAQQAIISNKHSAVTSRSCQQSAAKKMFPHSHWLESSFKTWWLILIKENYVQCCMFVYSCQKSAGYRHTYMQRLTASGIPQELHTHMYLHGFYLNSNRSTIFLAPSRAQGATKSVCPTGTKCSIMIFLSQVQVCLLALHHKTDIA